MSPIPSQPPVKVRCIAPGSAGGADARGVGVVTLARADKKNALTPAMLANLHDAVASLSARAERGEIAAVVLEGEGAAFCAGFDLTLCKDTSEALRELLGGLSRLIVAIRACAAPVVCASHGAALAGGCAIVCAADLVVTHHDAKLGYPVVRLGISPAVSAPYLNSAIGAGRSRERLLSSQLISGWEAHRAGLAHECIEDAGKVRDRAVTLAQQLAGKPGPGLRETKRWLNEIDGTTDTRTLESALAASLSLVGSAEERSRLAELWKGA